MPIPFSIRAVPRPKDGPSWTSQDLGFCKARVIDIDASTFFPKILESPAPGVSSSTITAEHKGPHAYIETKNANSNGRVSLPEQKFIEIENLRATLQAGAPSDEQDAVLNFATNFLNILGFTRPVESRQAEALSSEFTQEINAGKVDERKKDRRVIRRNYELPLFMGGRTVHALADLCIIHPSATPSDPNGDTVLLLIKVLRPSSLSPPSSPISDHSSEHDIEEEQDPQACAEAQLLAQAIAAFQQHNRLLRRLRLPPIDRKIVPALLMIGSQPVLYKIEVTANLVESVQSGQVPTCSTKMQRLILGSGSNSSNGRMSNGDVSRYTINCTAPVENRRRILQGLHAFKSCL